MTGDTPGSQSALREANQRRVLRAVRGAGSLTQAQIARATGLSAATVSNIVRQLRDNGAVVVAPTSSGGRRAQAVSLARDTGLAVGVHVTATHLRAAICDMAYEVLAEEQIPYQVGQSTERGLRRAEWLVSTMLRQARVDRTKIKGVGVALPGPIDAGSGHVLEGTVLANWQGVDVADELADRVGLPVEVTGDANAAALGELIWGAGRDSTELAYLKLSSGVGAALVINGEVYQGSGGLAGEFGHITVNDQGRICRCGNRGCLETVVGGPYLLDLLPRRPDETPPTLDRLIAAALGGDLGSRRVIADAGRAVGSAAAMLCNLLNPQRLIVGGELADAGELLLDPIQEMLTRQTLPRAAELVEVVLAELGDWSAARGALATVVRSAASLDDEAQLA
ncbi:MAG: ROK family protein [Micromonosporaceae bacterium]|nr:ROK family protein [Micromonosporaceae bacterium]